MSISHGRRSIGGQRDKSTLLFEVEGMPCVLSPYFFGVDIFVLMHTVFLGRLKQF